MAGYIDWYYAELERRQTTETEKSSAKGDGLGGTEVIGGTEFILDSDGGGTAGDTYYTPEQLERVREAEARRPSWRKRRRSAAPGWRKSGESCMSFIKARSASNFIVSC